MTEKEASAREAGSGARRAGAGRHRAKPHAESEKEELLGGKERELQEEMQGPARKKEQMAW